MNARCQMTAGYCRLLMFLAAIASMLSVCAAQEKSTTPKVYEPGEVYLEGSRVYIHVGKTGFGHEHAVEGQLKSGTLTLNEAKGELEFAMNTFNADTSAARSYIGLSGTMDAGTRSKVNANMRGSHVLDVARYPSAKFVVSAVSPTKQKSRRGLTQYQIDGEFTLHGKTHPIRFLADVESKDGWLHVRGGFTILQTNYGITPYSTGLGAIGVANKLTIWGDLWVSEKKQTRAAQTTDGSRN